jgi:hypothetical protein
MKGDVSSFVYIVVVLIAAIAILAMLFMRLGPFSIISSEEECKGKLAKACGKYEASGDLIKAFESIPSTCYSKVTACQGKPIVDSVCASAICKWIKSGG